MLDMEFSGYLPGNDSFSSQAIIIQNFGPKQFSLNRLPAY